MNQEKFYRVDFTINGWRVIFNRGKQIVVVHSQMTETAANELCEMMNAEINSIDSEDLEAAAEMYDNLNGG